jgi:hypothetical protein
VLGLKGKIISGLILGMLILNVIIIYTNNDQVTGSSSETKPRSSSRDLEYFEMNMNITEVSDGSYNAGGSVGDAGDVNGDGFDDFLISSGNKIYLIFGKPSGWKMDQDLSTADASFNYEPDYASIYRPVAGAGDVNGDGYDDILIGAYSGNTAGKTSLIFGKSSGWKINQSLSTADASFIGEDEGDWSGCSVDGAGDVNGDGYDDILIGAYGNDDGGNSAGKTYLIFGKSSGWKINQSLSNANASFIGVEDGDSSGMSVAGAGDVNGDGYNDILIGAWSHDDQNGNVYLFLGKKSGWILDQSYSTADASFFNENTSNKLGLCVSGAGDVNGDGYDDILMGDMVGPGKTYLIFGKDIGWKRDQDISNADASFLGDGVNSGACLTGAGDVNVDGYDDFLIGEKQNRCNIYLILGKNQGWQKDEELANADASFITDNSVGYGPIRWIAGVGDVNNDGGSDFIALKKWDSYAKVFLITGLGITEPNVVNSVKAYADDSYSPSKQITSAENGDTIYVELKGVDGNNSNQDKARVIVDNLNTSAADLSLILRETGLNTGRYRNTFKLSSRTAQGKRLLKASLDDIIKISSHKDPTKYTLLDVTAPVALKPFNDQLEAIEDEEYRVHYTNIGYNEVTSWSLESDSTWLNWNDQTHDLYGTPDNGDVGSCWARLNITDGLGNYDEHYFNINVTNTKPRILTENILYTNQSEYFHVDYNSDDEGQGGTQWKIISKPLVKDWLEFDTITGILNGTPGQVDVGKYKINITIDDGNGELNWTNFELEVKDIDYAPEIQGIPKNTTKEDEFYYANFSAVDKDNDVDFVWGLQTGLEFLSVDSSSGELSGIPTNDDVGVHNVNVTVKDPGGLIGWLNYTLEVINVNDPPKITAHNVILTYTSSACYIDYNATDVDSPISNQTWSLDTNATWLSIDKKTGILSGTPTVSDIGWFNINVMVSDGDGGTDWHNFILTVLPGEEPPVITTIDIETAWVGQLYEVDYDALDDRTPLEQLKWSLETNASWLHINSETGILHGTAIEEDIGNWYWVNITVVDFENNNDFHYFILTVIRKPNEIPQLQNYKLTPSKGDTNTEFSFTLFYSDADSQPPSIIQVVIDGIEYDMELQAGGIVSNGRYEFKTKLTEGEHTYYFTASDGIDTVTSNNFKTPNINKPHSEGKTGDIGSLIIGSIIVVIIIVILILIFLMLQRKRKGKQLKKEQETAEQQQPLVYPPNVYPTVITPQVPQQQVQPQAYPQDNQYLESPAMEPTSFDTTPAYPTPEQQQVIPSITEQPQEPFIQPEQEQIQDLDEE